MNGNTRNRSGQPGGWSELFLKEDWWAIWLGLGIILVAWAFFETGSSIKWLAVTPAKWAGLSELSAHFISAYPRYFAQFAVWLCVFSLSVKMMGHTLREFIPAFVFVYLSSVVIISIGAWKYASAYNLEPPLVALLLGLLISNFIGLPRWMDTGFRVEYYIKTGIVLLGAGGAVCGVSASIAVAGAVGAKKEHAPIAITMVIIWAIVMIFVLPLISRLLHLPAGVAGAWIGTSEFADAAGYAAAQTYGNLADTFPEIEGRSEDAVQAFTLMKVVGRDIWIGIWAFILSGLQQNLWVDI